MVLKQASLRFKITAAAVSVAILLILPLWMTCRHFDNSLKLKNAEQLTGDLSKWLQPEVLLSIERRDRESLSKAFRRIMAVFPIQSLAVLDPEGRIWLEMSGISDSFLNISVPCHGRNLTGSKIQRIMEKNGVSCYEFISPLPPLPDGVYYLRMVAPLSAGRPPFPEHSAIIALIGTGGVILILILSLAVSKRAVAKIQRFGRLMQMLSKQTLKEPSEFKPIRGMEELENYWSDTSGKIVNRFSGMVRAINRLEQANAELKTIRETYQSFCENAAEGIFRIKKDGEFLYVNPALAAILGYDSPSAMPGTAPGLFRDCNADERELVRFVKAIRNKGQISGHEIKVKRKDQAEIWVSVTARTVYHESGEILFYEGSTVDITDHVEADALKEAKIIAEEANRAKNEFIARMSHEIRTPMNAVIGFSKLALKSGLSGRQYEYVEKVSSSAAVLLDLINDILDFSKIESGKLQLEIDQFELAPMMNEIIDRYGDHAAEKGVDLILIVDRAVPDTLVGDAGRLSQILSKLVDNAVKFTQQGEIVIRAQAERIQENRAVITFSVMDTGIGLSEDHLPNLFSYFTQGDTSTTRKYEGAGLGLSICKQLVELMGGTIHAASKIGKGSQFTFTIDLIIPELETSSQVSPLEAFHGENGLILVKNDALADSIENMLVPYVQSVLTVPDMGEMERILAKTTVDFVVTDHFFDEQGVYDLIEKARKAYPASPLNLILILEYAESIVRHSHKRNAVFIRKPLRRADFYDRMKKAFGHPDLGDSTPADTPLGLECSGLADKKILLVEDNSINQQIAVDLLEGLGVSVTVADNGARSLDTIQSESFHAVLMDIQMPEMDGLEAARRMREMKVDIPIIALTAYTSKSDREACIQAGMNDHLPKPVNPGTLANMLVKWIVKAGFSYPESPEMIQGPQFSDENGAVPEDEPSVNFDAALKKLRGNKKLYLNILRQFRESYSDSAEKIRESVGNQDMACAKEISHAVKGVSGNIMAMGLHCVSRNLDLAIKENSPPEVLDILINDFKVSLNSVLESIDQFEAEFEESAPKSGVSPAGSGRAVTSAEIRPIAAELNRLLKQNSLNAAEYIDKLKGRLRNSPAGDDVTALSERFDRFDFKGAQRALCAIAEKLGVSLE